VHRGNFNDLATTIGSAVFVVTALNAGPVTRLLNLRLLVHLGRISYSLYLIHTVVLLILLHTLLGYLPLPVLLISTPFVSFLIAEAFYRLVEVPSTSLGRRLSSHLAGTTRRIGDG